MLKKSYYNFTSVLLYFTDKNRGVGSYLKLDGQVVMGRVAAAVPPPRRLTSLKNPESAIAHSAHRSFTPLTETSVVIVQLSYNCR